MVADCLSRTPVDITPDEVRRVTSEGYMDPVLAKIQKKQQQDEELADLIEYLECKSLPECAIRRS